MERYICVYSNGENINVFVTEDKLAMTAVRNLTQSKYDSYSKIYEDLFYDPCTLTIAVDTVNHVIAWLKCSISIKPAALTQEEFAHKSAYYFIKVESPSEFITFNDIKPSERFYQTIESIFDKFGVKYEYTDEDKRYLHLYIKEEKE